MEGVPKTEGHRYAVYTFSGYLSGKVNPIMVLDPRAQKVTYTPSSGSRMVERTWILLSSPPMRRQHILSLPELDRVKDKVRNSS